MEKFFASSQILPAVTRHLWGEGHEQDAGAILESPLLERYSKDLTFSYDRDLRRKVIANSAALNRVEIDRGLAWLASFGGAHSQIADAIRFSTSVSS